MSFHRRCGTRIHLSNLNRTARRNINDFNHGIVLSSESMVDDVWFQVRIDEKVSTFVHLCFNSNLQCTTMFTMFVAIDRSFTHSHFQRLNFNLQLFLDRHKHGMGLWKLVLHV